MQGKINTDKQEQARCKNKFLHSSGRLKHLDLVARVFVAAAFIVQTAAVSPAAAADVLTLRNDYVIPETEIAVIEENSLNTQSSLPGTSSGDLESGGWEFMSSTLSQADPELNEASGRVFYLSQTGSDSNNGSDGSAWSSLQHAVSQLTAGDTLVIREGHYKQSADFKASGRADAYITIRGEGHVVIGGTSAEDYMFENAFDTQGHDYIRFENLEVNHSAMAFEITPGSQYIEVDGLKTDGNRFALRINDAENVTVRNAYVINSKNGFRAMGDSRNLLFEDIETYGSKDIWDGMKLEYLNGDGFVMEREVSNVTLRNIITGDHWDAGVDIKSTNVLMENIISFGNKNNFKTWGENITIRNSLSYGAKRQLRPNGSTVEGHGITVEDGTTKVVNVTFSDNEHYDVRVYPDGALAIENSIVARRASDGWLFKSSGVYTSNNVLWFDEARTGPSSDLRMAQSDLWADPLFIDWAGGSFKLSSGSPAIDYASPPSAPAGTDLSGEDRIVNEQVDLGAYEFQADGGGTEPEPEPVPDPVFNLAGGETASGTILVRPDLTIIPDILQVQYRLDNASAVTRNISPFELSIDTVKLTNGAHTLSGIVTTPNGEKAFSIAFNVQNQVVDPEPEPEPEPQPEPQDALFTGIQDQTIVTGVLAINPNLSLLGDFKEIKYYIDGNQTDKRSGEPYTFYGKKEYDTNRLSDGLHTFAAEVDGIKVFEAVFYVNNNGELKENPFQDSNVEAEPEPETNPEAEDTIFTGVQDQQEVSGVIRVNPNLNLLGDFDLIRYYVDGGQKDKRSEDPFTFGGEKGYDTNRLTNGWHILSAEVDGEIIFTVQINVAND